MKILILEDEQRAASDLRDTIREMMPEAEFVGTLDSVDKALEWFSQNPTPDLAFFDIQLADGLSFEIFEETRVECPVIFCTAFDEYALQAFHVNGVDYIMKPFDRDAVRRALNKVKALDNFFQKRGGDGLESKIAKLLDDIRQPRTRTRFIVSQREKLLPINVSDIAFFSIEHELTFIHTFDNHRFMLNHTLDEVEAMLRPEDFYRANRQFLVNARAIVEVSPYFARKLLLKLSTPVPAPVIVSKAKASEFLRWLEMSTIVR